MRWRQGTGRVWRHSARVPATPRPKARTDEASIPRTSASRVSSRVDSESGNACPTSARWRCEHNPASVTIIDSSRPQALQGGKRAAPIEAAPSRKRANASAAKRGTATIARRATDANEHERSAPVADHSTASRDASLAHDAGLNQSASFDVAQAARWPRNRAGAARRVFFFFFFFCGERRFASAPVWRRQWSLKRTQFSRGRVSGMRRSVSSITSTPAPLPPGRERGESLCVAHPGTAAVGEGRLCVAARTDDARERGNSRVALPETGRCGRRENKKSARRRSGRHSGGQRQRRGRAQSTAASRTTGGGSALPGGRRTPRLKTVSRRTSAAPRVNRPAQADGRGQLDAPQPGSGDSGAARQP